MGDSAILDTVTILPLTQQDRQMVFDWQSEPMARQFSRNPNPPTWDEHCAWMTSFLDNPLNSGYIISVNDESCGFVRLATGIVHGDIQGKEISILLSAPFRQRDIASSALSLVIKEHAYTDIWAYILPENIASIRLFAKCGFAEKSDNWYLKIQAN